MEVWNPVLCKLFLRLSLGLVHVIHLVGLLRQGNVNVVKDDLRVVVTGPVPLYQETGIEGLYDSYNLNRIRFVLEISCSRIFDLLLVVSDLLSLSLFGHLVFQHGFKVFLRRLIVVIITIKLLGVVSIRVIFFIFCRWIILLSAAHLDIPLTCS